jgi:hypothetical protein
MSGREIRRASQIDVESPFRKDLRDLKRECGLLSMTVALFCGNRCGKHDVDVCDDFL